MIREQRKRAVPVGNLLGLFIKVNGLTAQLNTRRIFKAWDEASGVGPYTAKRFFRDGKLYVTLSSSVVCSQVSLQRRAIIEKINQLLLSDELFTKDDERVGLVQDIILR